MSYRKRGSSSNYVVVRKQGNHPVKVVAGTHHRLKRLAEKEANSLNKNSARYRLPPSRPKRIIPFYDGEDGK